MALSTIAADLSTWRPQRFGGGSIRKVADPLIEPAWEGLRVLPGSVSTTRPFLPCRRVGPVHPVGPACPSRS